ncbi:MAG TPA: TSUP family transporter [Solirubrobacteraceae bacterium]|nr:TSUP family transporter [Solirubrobacteraceae bacterium]
MIGAVGIGLLAGLLAGLLGVGGGVVFVPGLVLVLGLAQQQAEATSLLAIVPVAVLGTLRQNRYGNVCRADAALLGALSLAGVLVGVALADTLSGAALRDAFAGVMVLVAVQLLKTTCRRDRQSG